MSLLKFSIGDTVQVKTGYGLVEKIGVITRIFLRAVNGKWPKGSLRSEHTYEIEWKTDGGTVIHRSEFHENWLIGLKVKKKAKPVRLKKDKDLKSLASILEAL